MAWTYDSGTGRITHAGTNRDFARVSGTAENLPSICRVDVQCTDYTQQVRLLVLGSGDGGDGFEVGICADAGAANTDLSVRKVSRGEPENPPSSNVAHGLSGGQPYTLRVEIINGDTIKGYIIASGAIVASVTLTVTDYLANRAWGVVSEIDGATVMSITVTTLTQSSVGLSDTLWTVSGGDLAACYDDANLTIVQARAFPPDVDVSGVGFENKVYLVGGGRARVFDPITRVVANWNATPGTLPGYTTTGTTTANQVFAWGKTVGLTLIKNAPNQIWLSAIGNPLDFDTGSELFGAAAVITVPEPVVCCLPLTDQILIVVCTRSVYAFMGDPRISSERRQISSTVGGTGPKSTLLKIGSGQNIIHTVNGCGILSLDGIASLTQTILREPLKLIQTPGASYLAGDVSGGAAGGDSGGGSGFWDSLGSGGSGGGGGGGSSGGSNNLSDEWIPHLCYDPISSLVYVFLVHKSDATRDKISVYDERMGGYNPDGGGWLHDSYPDFCGPTASATWRGRAVLGGRDGYLRWFDSTENLDDGTESIDNALPFMLIDAPGLENDVQLKRLRVLLSNDSDSVTIRVWGGRDPQEVYDQTYRTKKFEQNFTLTSPPSVPRVRDPALVVEVSGAGDGIWSIEYLEADVDVGTFVSFQPRTTATAGAATGPTSPPTNPSTGSAGTGPDLPSGQPGGPGA